MAGNGIRKSLVLVAAAYCATAVFVFIQSGGEAPSPAVFPIFAKGLILAIPKLDVAANIQTVGSTAQGDIGIPSDFTDVAWFTGSAKPGALGTSVIVGHKDSGRADKGVFRDIGLLEPGDDVYVYDKGVASRFRVVRLETFPAGTSRMAEVLGDVQGKSQLNLITCTGAWNGAARQYEERLVVFTERVE